MVIKPLFAFGTTAFRSASIKKKLSGDGRQVSGVFVPGVLLTRSIRKLRSAPVPSSGDTPSFT
jgi:hypothetical protein